MTEQFDGCPDCERGMSRLDRRQFLGTAGALGAAAVAGNLITPIARAAEAVSSAKSPETLVKKLYDSLSDDQRKKVAFAWDFTDDERGLLRSHVGNNWQITKVAIKESFYTKDQKDIIRAIFEGFYQPDWVKKIDRQLKDDAGGYGNAQSIAIFGKPGDGKFELVMTGRHLTMRCDGNSAEHVAFGGPIFYGHAASGFNEKPSHPGNIFWEQAIEANKVYSLLDGKQQKIALLEKVPEESAVAFQGPGGKFPGIPIADLSSDQKEQVQKTLQKLLEPYRTSNRKEAMTCLKAQGGLDHCSLAFYKEEDIGNDGVWDNWRIEGPSFVWYFRGSPHVHVWVNVSDDPSVETNS